MSAQYDTDQYKLEKQVGERRENGAKNLRRLKPWHRAAIKAHIAGVSSNIIAARFRKRPATISLILHDPLAQAEIERARQLHETEFSALYGQAVGVLRTNLQGKDQKNALKATQIYFKELESQRSAGKGERTAEDVIQEIFSRITLNQNVQINMNGGGS